MIDKIISRMMDNKHNPSRRKFMKRIMAGAAGFVVGSFGQGIGLSGDYSSIAEEFLEMEKEISEELKIVHGDGMEDKYALRSIAGSITPYVLTRVKYDEESVITTLRSIDSKLREYNFGHKEGGNNILNNSIESGDFDSKNLCVFYMALSEELKIPLSIAKDDNCMYIKWSLEDGGSVYWDTTKGQVKTKGNKKDLSRNQIIGLHHNDIGKIWERRGKIGKAIKSYENAIKLDSGLTNAHYNLSKALKYNKVVKK